MNKLKSYLIFFSIIISVILLINPKEVSANNWITSCAYSHSANDDPIVFPGSPGASHLHDFMGARTANANSTANSLISGATNCATNGDHSSYWVPALYKNGNIRQLPGGTIKDLLAYYINQGGPVQPFPFGLRMVMGNARATSPADNPGFQQGRIEFSCGPGTTKLSMPPSSCSTGTLQLIFTFPNCWDGRNLDSADHLSHMAYGGNNCPSSHPVRVPILKVFIRYGAGNGNLLPVNLASGPYYTAHIDFFNAWNPAAISELVDRCLNSGGGSCGQNPPVSAGGPIPMPMPTKMATSMPIMGGMRPWDVNSDGLVNIIDIGIVIDNYGRQPIVNPKTDLNHDGVVNIIDIGIIIDNYGR